MLFRFRKTPGGRPEHISLFDLAPRGVYLATPVTKRAGELLPHRFTHHRLRRLVCSLLHLSSLGPVVRRPDVIRLAALWCSDFPLLLDAKAIARSASLHGTRQYNKKRLTIKHAVTLFSRIIFVQMRPIRGNKLTI